MTTACGPQLHLLPAGTAQLDWHCAVAGGSYDSMKLVAAGLKAGNEVGGRVVDVIVLH